MNWKEICVHSDKSSSSICVTYLEIKIKNDPFVKRNKQISDQDFLTIYGYE